MLKTVEDINSTKKRLRIEIPGEAIEREIRQSLDDLRRRTKLPGFREGKAPMSLLERRFGKDVEGEVLEKIIPRYYSEAVKEAALRPVSNPVFEERLDFKRNAPLLMTMTVEVMPKIGEIKYKGLKIKNMPVEVQDEEVESTLERLGQERATLEPSKEGLEEGDYAVIDYEIKEDGASFKDQMIKVGDPSLPPGLSSALIERKAGEEFDLQVDFPEDYNIKEAAGKSLLYHILLKEAKKPVYPAIDDDFAKDLGREDLRALRDFIKERLLRSKKDTVRRINQAAIMRQIVEAHDLDVPDSLLEDESSALLGEAEAAGKTGGKDKETLKNEMTETARRNIKASVFIKEIGEREGVEVSEDEIKEKVGALSERLSLSPENVMKYYVAKDGSLDGLRRSVFEEKVLDLLIENAEPEEEPK